jgi:hypothetical protein
MNRLAHWLAGVQAVLLAMLGGAAAGAQTAAPADDEAAWQQARAAGSPEAYQRYLELHPVGAYAGEAFRSIIELTVAAAPGAVPARESGAAAARSLAADMY